MMHNDIVGLADIHGDLEAIERIGPDIANAGTVLLLGDITHFGRAKQAKAVVDTVARYNPRILAIRGNCDHPEVSEYLAERGVSLDSRRMIINGVALIGIGGSLPCPSPTPNEIDEVEFETTLDAIMAKLPPGMPMVLASHQPPYDTGADVAGGGKHVGSKSLRRFIREHQPLACLTGHIHEAGSVSMLGQCHVINPGPLREGRYAWLLLGEKVTGPTVMACEIRKA